MDFESVVTTALATVAIVVLATTSSCIKSTNRECHETLRAAVTIPQTEAGVILATKGCPP